MLLMLSGRSFFLQPPTTSSGLTSMENRAGRLKGEAVYDGKVWNNLPHLW